MARPKKQDDVNVIDNDQAEPVTLWSVYDAGAKTIAYDADRRPLRTSNRDVADAVAKGMIRGVVCEWADLGRLIDAGFPVV